MLATHIGPLCKTCQVDDGPLLGCWLGFYGLKGQVNSFLSILDHGYSYLAQQLSMVCRSSSLQRKLSISKMTFELKVNVKFTLNL